MNMFSGVLLLLWCNSSWLLVFFVGHYNSWHCLLIVFFIVNFALHHMNEPANVRLQSVFVDLRCWQWCLYFSTCLIGSLLKTLKNTRLWFISLELLCLFTFVMLVIGLCRPGIWSSAPICWLSSHWVNVPSFSHSSENSYPGRPKHWKEYLMVSTARQEVCGGVHTYSGDSSDKYPLELQKWVGPCRLTPWQCMLSFHLCTACGSWLSMFNVCCLCLGDLFQWHHIKVKTTRLDPFSVYRSLECVLHLR